MKQTALRLPVTWRSCPLSASIEVALLPSVVRMLLVTFLEEVAGQRDRRERSAAARQLLARTRSLGTLPDQHMLSPHLELRAVANAVRPLSSFVRRVSMRRPLPIIIAIVTISLILGLNIVSVLVSTQPLQSVIGIIFGALLLIGLVRAHRLAWQWGRYLAPFAGLVFLLGALTMLRIGSLANMLVGTLYLLLALGILGFPVLLSRSSAVQYFNLVCPDCAARTTKAGDFFFNHAKCRKCQRVW